MSKFSEDSIEELESKIKQIREIIEEKKKLESDLEIKAEKINKIKSEIKLFSDKISLEKKNITERLSKTYERLCSQSKIPEYQSIINENDIKLKEAQEEIREICDHPKIIHRKCQLCGIVVK